MNTNNTKQTDNSSILPYQRPVFGQLCAVARACLFVDRSQFQVIKPRCNFLVIGPSGSGKTHLSQIVAKEVDLPILSLSLSDWILLGCGGNRGGTNTWPLIVDFISTNISKQGAIIFLDEIHQCHSDSEWSNFLKIEIYSMLDGRVPLGIKDLGSESNSYSDDTIAEIENFLKNKTMILGGAAFQEIWDERSSTGIGFNSVEDSTDSEPQLSDLANFLPRELINRFSSKLFVIPQIKKIQYFDMITAMARHIPEVWRDRFISVGLANLDTAVRHQKGARYAEETLLSAIVDEKAYLLESIPPKEVENTGEPEFKNDDYDDINIF